MERQIDFSIQYYYPNWNLVRCAHTYKKKVVWIELKKIIINALVRASNCSITDQQKLFFAQVFHTCSECIECNENVGDLNFQVNRPLIKRMNAHWCLVSMTIYLGEKAAPRPTAAANSKSSATREKVSVKCVKIHRRLGCSKYGNLKQCKQGKSVVTFV